MSYDKSIIFLPSPNEHRFLLNTRKNPTEHQILSYKDDFSVRSSHFRGNRRTKFIVHGFIDYGTRKWLMVRPRMCVYKHIRTHSSRHKLHADAVRRTIISTGKYAFMLVARGSMSFCTTPHAYSKVQEAALTIVSFSGVFFL